MQKTLIYILTFFILTAFHQNHFGLVSQARAANVFESLFLEKKQHHSNRQKIIERELLQRKLHPPQKSVSPVSPIAPHDEVQKNDEMSNILIFGDEMASSLANGFKNFYKNKEPYYFIDAGYSNLALLNPHEDILMKMENQLNKNNISLVVFFFGKNDYAYLRDQDENAYNFYQAHLENLCDFLDEKNINWLWMGIPALKKDDLRNDVYRKMNHIFFQIAKKYNKTYLSNWNAFATLEPKDALDLHLDARSYVNNGSENLYLKNNYFTKIQEDQLAFLSHKAIEFSIMSPNKPLEIENLEENEYKKYIPPTPIFEVNGKEKQLMDNDGGKDTQKENPNLVEDSPFERVDNFFIKPKLSDKL